MNSAYDPFVYSPPLINFCNIQYTHNITYNTNKIMGWEEKAQKAKKGHRPSLKNWERDNLHSTFPQYAKVIINSNHPYRSFKIIKRRNLQTGELISDTVERSVSLDTIRDTINNNNQKKTLGRVRYYGNDYHGTTNNNSNNSNNEIMYPIVLDASTTPQKEFHERYEAKCIPVVIRNIPYGASCSSNLNVGNRGREEYDGMEEEKKECDNTPSSSYNHQHSHQINSNNYDKSKIWPAVTKWDLNTLATDPDLSARPLKCGENDDGYTIRIKLRYFIQYLQNNKDDSPLYIFDATFDEDKYAKRILDDYTVPEYFNEDLLGLVGERRRPPYRWFLVGPCRSGTTVHIDPLGTSAWNTLIHGVKRWVLFPPHVPKSVVKGRKLILPGEDDEAIHYFTTILPRMKRRAAAAAAASGSGKGEYANFECYEFTQYAGETVFVPHGWWHAVLNITHTVGITQNYCSRRNFDEVWKQTRSGRKKMSCSWLRRLEERYPDLADRAKELNRKDGYVMWEDNPVEQKKWRKKKAEKERKKKAKQQREEKKQEREEKKKGKSKASSKKEKWGEHRTTERTRKDTDYDQDVAMRDVSPGDY